MGVIKLPMHDCKHVYPSLMDNSYMTSKVIYIVKLLVFLVTNGGSGYITQVDELEVILQDVFGGELLHTKSAIS